jgi:hypothetical protein
MTPSRVMKVFTMSSRMRVPLYGFDLMTGSGSVNHRVPLLRADNTCDYA